MGALFTTSRLTVWLLCTIKLNTVWARNHWGIQASSQAGTAIRQGLGNLRPNKGCSQGAVGPRAHLRASACGHVGTHCVLACASQVTSEEDMDALAARATTAGLPHYIVVRTQPHCRLHNPLSSPPSTAVVLACIVGGGDSRLVII